jgi:hypothetical protein
VRSASRVQCGFLNQVGNPSLSGNRTLLDQLGLKKPQEGNEK